ncbi:RNA-binding protein Nova-1-like isoform X3 [Babylonia areolata]|uniref:RNA-binding protein Nova-1-like isoform X3 n=1 Tax=Babylonia areolata TaxID=304850 RepID=UPI003FCF1D9D
MAMNYDGMNGSDMDTSDSRKRPLDGDTDNGVTKRSNQGPSPSSYSSGEGDNANVSEHGDLDSSLTQHSEQSGDNIHLKILVPSIAAGAIIGKGGETIAQVQKEAGARVKMSKANDFYPGTTERVCLIMGPAEAVRKVHIFIMEKIRDKPDPSPKPEDAKTNYERHRQVIEVKVLVPNSTAGMIIGKSGNYIKQIKEESGAYVQISQKAKETNLPERCVTIAGEMEANKKAVDMILSKIVEDPQSGSCPNISYADYTGPVASSNPTGSPFANTPYTQQRSQEMVSNNNYTAGSFNSFGVNGNSFNMGGGGGMGFGLNIATLTGGGPMTGAALENLKMTLRNSGFADQATEEIAAAMSTLASYGILGMGLGLGQMNTMNTGMGMGAPAAPMGGVGQAGMQGMQGMQSMQSIQGMPMASASTPTSSVSSGFLNTSNNSTSAASIFGPVGSTSSGLGSSGSTGASSSLFGSSSPSIAQGERYGGSPMLNDSFTGAAANYATPSTAYTQVGADRTAGVAAVNMNQNSFGLGTGMYSPTEDKANGTTKQDIEVPENIVGAILGPGGKGIVEIQQFTGTNIQISKKGVYAPGTRNRIVSITGTPTNITRAHYMIQQRIQQEEYKRARQASQR